MKSILWFCSFGLLLVMVPSASRATTRYVSLNNKSPVSPYTSWSTAATNIQTAIDAAVAGDQILVTNGVYQTGGRIAFDSTSNRVAITKALTVRSINGPAVTSIVGYQVPGTTNGPSAMRCVYMANGATLIGFTLTNGATATSASTLMGLSGGGVCAASLNTLVSNCVIVGNAAKAYGGGAYSNKLVNCTLANNSAGSGGGTYYSTLYNCMLTGNSAGDGGGAYYGVLNNCTLTGNSALAGGGAVQGALNNCIIYYNWAIRGPNCSGGALNYCCTTPLPSSGTGNIQSEPELASASHLSAGSPCRGAGNLAYSSWTDIDDEPWVSPPSIGCDEIRTGGASGPITVRIGLAYADVAAGFELPLTAWIGGTVTASRWEFGDGTVVSNRPWTTHAWSLPAKYPVVLRAYNDSNPGGVATTTLVHVVTQPVHYVVADGTAARAPYTSWSTAATNIQDAVDAVTVGGALVLVSNGVYAAGGRMVNGSLTNRVAVTNGATVRSVNGPGVTLIVGRQIPGITNGFGAVRCAYLGSGAALVGFTLTNGATLNSGSFDNERSGGGVWCVSPILMVSNCVLAGNCAAWSGGGAFQGALNHCTLAGNSSLLDGGGACYSTLDNCTLMGNTAYQHGGGVYSSTLRNCVLTGNSAKTYGGGAYGGTLNNCVLTGNSSPYLGGGVTGASLTNSIVYYNSAPSFSNYLNGSLAYCCTEPLPDGGLGNFTNAPCLVDPIGGNLRLQSNSPCINAGANSYAAGLVDLDGNPRIAGGTLDVGAYEYPGPASTLSYAWLQQYGLPTDGSADHLDSDSDGLSNWQEWVAGTDPTNAASVLRMLWSTNSGLGRVVAWTGVPKRFYSLERAVNPGEWSAFSLVSSNIPGQNGITTFTDIGANSSGILFYRVRVEQ